MQKLNILLTGTVLPKRRLKIKTRHSRTFKLSFSNLHFQLHANLNSYFYSNKNDKNFGRFVSENLEINLKHFVL